VQSSRLTEVVDLVAAVIAAAAAPLSFIGLGTHVRARRSARRMYCSVDGPPLQRDPELCPIAPSPPMRQDRGVPRR